jgi:glucosyl-3-phosphoglycerate synthase
LVGVRRRVLVDEDALPYIPMDGYDERGDVRAETAMLPAPFRVDRLSLRDLARLRWDLGTTVSVCLPARDEEATIGSIVGSIHRDLIETEGLVDEVIVLDDGSADRTAERAALAGARVERVDSILPELPPGSGKGDALWKSLFVSRGDLICWVDADIRNFHSHLVWRLLAPLLIDPRVELVKGYFRRPADGSPHGGGRVTELVARPLIAKLFPHLAGIIQPLAGATAGRRRALEAIPFVEGWGVEFAMLVDVARRSGLGAVAQVDLGSVEHDRRSLTKLVPQAMAILTVALRRAGLEQPVDPICELLRFDEDHEGTMESVPVAERPPMRDVAGYATRLAAELPA